MSAKDRAMNSEQEPTIDNVLDEYKAYVRNAQQWAKHSGAIISIFGGSPCPWCKSHMTQTTLSSLVAVCDKNSLHIVQWVPWGG